MDFHLMREARKEAETYLRSFGIDISDQSLGDAMSSYFNIKHKLIEKAKRNVNWAKHIRQKAKALNCLEIILEIERKFKDGGDINPYLSKGVLRADDHDILLNDWLINHLHLSNTKRRRSDFFFERSNFLLFFYLEQGNVYFIDIRAHGEEFLFAKKELLEIVNENWPEVEEKFRFGDGTMRSTHDLSEEQLSMLRARRVGLLTTTEIDGITYMPGSGSSTSGFSVKARREMHGFHRSLHSIQEYLDENYSELKSQINRKLGLSLREVNFSVKLIDGIFYVYETNTESFISFES